MSDQKITQLAAVTTLLTTDVIPVVINVASTPLNKKIAFSDLQTLVLAGATITSIKAEDIGTPRSGALEIKAGTGITISDASGVFTISGAAAGITALTGDVTATGSGSVAATVAFVGGSTAANVHAAELLANAATSAATVSAIVRRDASGNFSAGTITATLTGNASTASTAVTVSDNAITPAKISITATDDFTFPRTVFSTSALHGTVTQPTTTARVVASAASGKMAIAMTGLAIDASTDTDGLAFYMLHNGNNNRQLGLVDTKLGPVGGTTCIRFAFTPGPGIDAFNADLSGAQVPSLGANGKGIVVVGPLAMGGVADATALMTLISTTQGFLPPRMTSTQRDAISTPSEGLVIYNTSTHKLNVFTTGWEQVTSA